MARKRSILSSGYYHGLSLNQISHIQILDKSGGRNVTLHTFDKSILQFSRKFLYDSLNQISHIQILDKSGGRNVTLHTFDKSILQFSRKFLYVFIKFLERRATLHTFGSPLPILI